MRLFIAIPFAASVVDALCDTQTKLKRDGVRGSFTARPNLHLTVAFLGEVRDPRPVLAALERVPLPQMTLSFRQFSSFRDILVLEPERSQTLTDYANALRKALDNCGIDYDRKPFRAHITLVRRADIPPQTALSAYLPALRGCPVEVSRVQLMRTDFINGRAKYTCLAFKETS